jgi:YHS domain-containing protein
MFRATCLYLWLFVALTAAMLAGCSPRAGSDQSPGTPTGKAAGTAGGPAADADAPQGEAAAVGLAELSPDDRAAAEKQRACPVTGERLGIMGKPYKVTVKGQTLFLCCSGCEEELKQDPDKYLAKLGANEKK